MLQAVAADILALLLLLFRVVALGRDGVRQRRHTLVLLVVAVLTEDRTQRGCRMRGAMVQIFGRF